MTTSTLKDSKNADGPLVSIVIPAYRVTEYIKETLDSALAQTYRNFEIVIINDGTPDTPELEDVLRPYMDKIVYVKQENRGLSGARNRGIQESTGSLLAFLDGDDLWLPEFLEEQVKFIQSDPVYDLVYCNAYHFGDDCVGMTYMETCPSAGEVNFESLITARCNVIASGALARKDSLMKAGPFDETLRSSEDFDLWIRLSKIPNTRMNYQRKVLVGYRHRPGSLSTDITRQLEHSLKVFDKILTREDLSPGERVLVERTLAAARAKLAIRQAKGHLLQRNFEEAERLFRSAQSQAPNWKVTMTLAGIRIFPRVFHRLYRRLAA